MTSSRTSAVVEALWFAVFALLLAGCVTPETNAESTTGDTEAPELTSEDDGQAPSPIAKVIEEPTDSEVTTDSVSSTDSPPVTIQLPENTAENAPELAAAINIPSRSFPSAYSLEDVEDDEPFCVDVEAPDVARTPLGKSERRAQGSHLVSISTYVYADNETAIDSVEYARSMFDRCNEAYVDDTPGEEVLAYHRRVDPVDAPVELDELLSVDSSFSNTTETRYVYGDVGRSGSIVFIAATTDPELLPQLTRRLSDRIEGLAGDGAMLVPRGTQDVGPGLGDATYWSWDEGPDGIRGAPLATTEAVAFTEAADDVRLDQLAGSACAAVWTYSAQDDVQALATSLFSKDELDEYGGNVAEVATAAMALYCPGFHDFYVSEIERTEQAG